MAMTNNQAQTNN